MRPVTGLLWWHFIKLRQLIQFVEQFVEFVFKLNFEFFKQLIQQFVQLLEQFFIQFLQQLFKFQQLIQWTGHHVEGS